MTKFYGLIAPALLLVPVVFAAMLQAARMIA